MLVVLFGAGVLHVILHKQMQSSQLDVRLLFVAIFEVLIKLKEM